MPSTPSLLYHLLSQSISSLGSVDFEEEVLSATLAQISRNIGFEITLSDFWQICRDATSQIYESFGGVEQKCLTNRVHTFMAYWLSTGGTVITTNYDRLIEREGAKMNKPIQSRYEENGANSFIRWQEDLSRGGCLFKIHGSLDEPNSCLGALEHVGTQLSGCRAELVAEIARKRPLCFVGWQGIDPDIPVTLHEELKKRDSSLLTFWIHFEGYTPGSVSLEKAIEDCSPLIKPYAENQPILTEADRAFSDLLTWVGIQSIANPEISTLSFDFSKAISQCTKTGLARMVGITLRRAGKPNEATQILNTALKLAETPGERSAALQEISLLQQRTTGKDINQALKSLERARKTLEDKPDIRLQLNADFGTLSMSVVALKKHPWLVVRLPRLFRRYQHDIEALKQETKDKESVALHQSLLQLYLGRSRFILWGWLGIIIYPVGNWILKPFDVARSTIDGAKDIHLHSRVDVLAYRAITLAHLQRCQEAGEDVSEINRLVAILKDEARTQHWLKQSQEITKYCD